MTATDIITRCDRIKPNEYSYIQKRKWLDTIESEIRQYITLYSNTEADMSFVEEENPSLALGEDFADIYLYYIISMIDLSNQEYALYNNSSAFYNDRMRKWQRKYRRENLPCTKTSIKV